MLVPVRTCSSSVMSAHSVAGGVGREFGLATGSMYKCLQVLHSHIARMVLPIGMEGSG